MRRVVLRVDLVAWLTRVCTATRTYAHEMCRDRDGGTDPGVSHSRVVAVARYRASSGLP